MNEMFSGNAGLFSGMLIGFVIGAVFYFFYLKNLYDLLNVVREPNRTMSPNGVWFIALNCLTSLFRMLSFYFIYKEMPAAAIIVNVLIYIVGIFVVIWHFRVVRAVADSIEAEFDSRKIPIEHRPSYQTGMFMAMAGALTLVGDITGFFILARLITLAFLIGMIVYWVRVHKYKKEIESFPEHHDADSMIFKDL
jgi:hypothetical protein